MKTGRYRIRKGLNNCCVVQYEYDSPAFIGGQVCSDVRHKHWADVPFDKLADIRVFLPKAKEAK